MSHQSKIWVTPCLPRIALCQGLYRSTCINCGQPLSSRSRVYASLLSQTEPIGSLLAVVTPVSSASIHCLLRGVAKSVVLNPSPAHQFCRFGLKYRRGLFGDQNNCLMAALEWHSLVWFLLPSYLSRRGYRFPGTPSDEALEPVSTEHWHVHSSAILWIHETWETNRRTRGLSLRPSWKSC